MPRILDEFEFRILKRIYLGFAAIFFCSFLYTLITNFNYPYPLQYRKIVLALRLFAIALNLLALAPIVLKKPGRTWLLPAGIALTFINFSISQISGFFMVYDLATSAVSFLIYPVFVFILGLFVRKIWLTVTFAVVVFLNFIAVYIAFPSFIFAESTLPADFRQNLILIALSLLVVTLLVILLSNSVHSMLYDNLKRKQSYLEKLAFYDQETGLPNVRELLDTVEKDIRELDIRHSYLLLAGIRIMRLEEMNERMGHANMISWMMRFTGELGASIDAWARKRSELTNTTSIQLYRVEPSILVFTLVLPDYVYRKTTELPTEWSKTVLDVLQMEHSDSLVDFYGTFSVYPSDAPNASGLLNNLLNVLRRSSPEDKSRFVPFNLDTFNQYLRKERLQEQMLSDSFITEIHAVFQPKVSVATGRCSGFEALARWKNPILGNVPPDEFISLAEQNHAIETVTKKILADIVLFVEQMRGITGIQFRVAFNLSPILLSREYLSSLISWITEKNLGAWIEIEITEGVLLNTTQSIEEDFTRLKQTGVSFAIDDFGTGYSNLAYLQSFQAEVIKIDKCFIDGLPGNEKNTNLVHAILQMARAFGMKSVAEGVEYAEQLNFLADAGCDQIQGYYFSKPLENAAALEWFTKQQGAPAQE